MKSKTDNGHNVFRKSNLILVGLAIGSMSLAMVPSVSHADDLDNQQATIQQQIKDSDGSVLAADNSLSAAEQKLAASQQQLSDAQNTLSKAQADRDAAAAQDQAAAQALSDAEAALEKAKAAADKAKTDAENQKRKLGADVQAAAQQNSSLVAVGVLIGSTSTTDLANKVQWSNQALQTQNNALVQLQQVQANLEQAEAAQQTAEQTAEKDRQAAADALATKQQTADAANDAEQKVNALVEQNSADKAAAEKALADAQAHNEELKAQSDAIAAKIQQRNEQAAAAAASAQAQAAAAGSSVASSTNSVLMDPVPGAPITDTYHTRINPILGITEFHDGLDLGGNCGAPIYAAAAGTVAEILTPAQSGGYGNRLVLDHGLVNGVYLSTGYNHATDYVVSAGQHVNKGQLIGHVGTTGLSTGCHLHFHVYVNGKTDNPQNWITVA